MGLLLLIFFFLLIKNTVTQTQQLQQHPPPPPPLFSGWGFWTWTVDDFRDCAAPPEPCFTPLCMCVSLSVFASCSKRLSMLSALFAEVSKNGISFSWANWLPRCVWISLSVRSLLFPISILCTVVPAYLSTSESHSGRFRKVVAEPMSYTRTMASALL